MLKLHAKIFISFVTPLRPRGLTFTTVPPHVLHNAEDAPSEAAFLLSHLDSVTNHHRPDIDDRERRTSPIAWESTSGLQEPSCTPFRTTSPGAPTEAASQPQRSGGANAPTVTLGHCDQPSKKIRNPQSHADSGRFIRRPFFGPRMEGKPKPRGTTNTRGENNTNNQEN
jgi:hypothetical protein